MALLIRRDHRRFLTLAGVAAVVLLSLVVSQQHEITPAGVLAKWKPNKIAQYTVDEAFEDEPYYEHGETPTTSSGTPTVPSISVFSQHSTHMGMLALTGEQTTIPSTALETDPSVKVAAQTYGFNLFDKLYLRNGTLYIVADNTKSFPERRFIITQIMETVEDDTVDVSDKYVRFITPSEARNVLGERATIISGTSVIITDPPMYLSHFYHFWGEVVLGTWRVYSTLALGKSPDIDSLPFPSRWIMPFVETDAGWRDRAGLNAPLIRLAFPNAFIEKNDIWNDWKKMGSTLVFERAMIVNRRSAHLSPFGGTWFKMLAGTMDVTVPKSFWEPVRRSLTKSLLGYIPQVADSGKALEPPKFKAATSNSRSESTKDLKPIVTYISRQSTGRRLRNDAHQGLVLALRKLEKEGVCVVRIPVMEDLTLQEQMAETTSSTIMVGVHGNGLTHQMFMPPSLRSAVYEIQPPNSYAFDYEMLARNMGHKHYMVLNDTLLTYPPGTTHQGVDFAPGFHGPNIPVDGEVLANAIRLRLTQPTREVEP